MTITLQRKEGLGVTYNTDEIACIENDKASNRYAKSDLAGNGIRPNDSLLIITFKDGTEISFSNNWRIIF